MNSRFEFIYLQIFGMFLLLLGLYSLGALNPINYVVVSFIWLLIVVEYTRPPIVRPRWHRRLRYIIVMGVIVFAFVTMQRIETLTAPPPTPTPTPAGPTPTTPNETATQAATITQQP